MRFETLGPKEPSFKERVVFMNEEGQWWDGFLVSKTESLDGTKYIVTIWDREKNEQVHTDKAKYFMRITAPKQ